RRHREEPRDLRRVLALTPLALEESRIAQLSLAYLADATEDSLASLGIVLREPVLEERVDRLREPEEHPAGALRAGVGRSGEDTGDLGVVEPGDDRTDHHADGDPRVGEGPHGSELPLGTGGPRLHAPGELRVERRDREHDVRGTMPRELGEEIGVARNQRRLGDRGHGVTELREDLEAAARDAEPTLDRLVAVRVAREGDDLRLPARRGEFCPQELGRVLLHHDAPLEVEPGAEAEVLVRRAGVAIVRRKTGREEGPAGRLDVDDVGDGARLDGENGLRLDVHLVAVERADLAQDRGATGGEEADPVDEPSRETERARSAGARFKLESEAEDRGVPLHALEDGQIDLRETE